MFRELFEYPFFSFLFIGLFLTAFNVRAITLSEAVNEQLAYVSVPCDTLLGGDDFSVLTGELASVICSRAFPLGGAPQNTEGSAASLSSLSSSSMTGLKGKEQAQEVQLGAKWTMFLTGESEVLNSDGSYSEDGYESNAARMVIGATYAQSTQTDFGIAFTIQKHKGDYDQGGDFETESGGIRALVSHYISSQLFFQATAGFDKVSSMRSRLAIFEEYAGAGLLFSASGEAKSDFDYDQTELSFLVGYNYSYGSITLVPTAGITWLESDYGTFSETGSSGLELTFHDDKVDSLQSRIGVQATMAVSTGFGVVIPQLDATWIHENEHDSRQVNVSFTQDTRAKRFYYDTQALDSNFIELGAGAVFVFSAGKQMFIRAQSILKHDYYDNYVVSAGLNIEL